MCYINVVLKTTLNSRINRFQGEMKMEYKIIVDSCGEFTEDMKKSEVFQSIPLYIMIEGLQMVDDEKFDRDEFLKIASSSKECPRSACPSPEQYLEAFKGEQKRIYVVTLSGNLSGSFNSATLAKQMMEEDSDKEIYVFDSRSASVGETLIALKIKECEDKGLSFAEVIYEVEKYIESQNTFFVLEDLETLRKNGRLSGMKMLVASALHIKPILGATPEGTIQQIGTARGMKKAIKVLVDEVVKAVKNPEEKILAIANCNSRKRAEDVKNMLLAQLNLKDILILDTSGISTMYASEGGIIVVV